MADAGAQREPPPPIATVALPTQTRQRVEFGIGQAGSVFAHRAAGKRGTHTLGWQQFERSAVRCPVRATVMATRTALLVHTGCAVDCRFGCRAGDGGAEHQRCSGRRDEFQMDLHAASLPGSSPVGAATPSPAIVRCQRRPTGWSLTGLTTPIFGTAS